MRTRIVLWVGALLASGCVLEAIDLSGKACTDSGINRVGLGTFDRTSSTAPWLLPQGLPIFEEAGRACAARDFLVAYDVSGSPASPSRRGNDLLVWQDGDLMIASDQGILRLHLCGSGDPCRTIQSPMLQRETHDLDLIDPANGLPSLVAAVAQTGAGISYERGFLLWYTGE